MSSFGSPNQTVLRSPVSILERLIPAIAFAITAIGGAVGSMLLDNLFDVLRASGSAGSEAIYTGLAKIDAIVAGILLAGLILGGVGLIICFARMFTVNQKASPPGLLFLMIGCLSLVPAILLGVSNFLILASLEGVPNTTPAFSLVKTMTIVSIGAACIMILILGAFSFVSFSSKAGRKFSPLLLLLLVEVGMACTTAGFFWFLKLCLIRIASPYLS